MTTLPEQPERRAQAAARRIRGLMAEQRVRGVDVARKLQMSQPSFSRRVTGELPFSVDEIETVAGLLGVDEAYLYGFSNERGPRSPGATEGQLYAIRDSNPEPAD